MSYTHLSQNERYQIHTMLDLWPVAEIATRLGRHESTIRREMARNRGERGYRPRQAQMLADERSIGSRNAACISPVIWTQALELLMAMPMVRTAEVKSPIGAVLRSVVPLLRPETALDTGRLTP